METSAALRAQAVLSPRSYHFNTPSIITYFRHKRHAALKLRYVIFNNSSLTADPGLSDVSRSRCTLLRDRKIAVIKLVAESRRGGRYFGDLWRAVRRQRSSESAESLCMKNLSANMALKSVWLFKSSTIYYLECKMIQVPATEAIAINTEHSV